MDTDKKKYFQSLVAFIAYHRQSYIGELKPEFSKEQQSKYYEEDLSSRDIKLRLIDCAVRIAELKKRYGEQELSKIASEIFERGAISGKCIFNIESSVRFEVANRMASLNSEFTDEEIIDMCVR